MALETFVHQPTLAAEFWGDVAKNNVGAQDERRPSRALLQWLHGTKRTGGDVAQREHCRAAAAAFNAAFREEAPKYIQPNAMGAFYLLGTPWAQGVGKDEE